MGPPFTFTFSDPLFTFMNHYIVSANEDLLQGSHFKNIDCMLLLSHVNVWAHSMGMKGFTYNDISVFSEEDALLIKVQFGNKIKLVPV